MLTCLAGQNIYHVCFPIEKYLLGRKDTISGDRICAFSRGLFVLCTFLWFQGQQLDKTCQGSLLSQDSLPPSSLFLSFFSSISFLPSQFSPTILPLSFLLSFPISFLETRSHYIAQADPTLAILLPPLLQH